MEPDTSNYGAENHPGQKKLLQRLLSCLLKREATSGVDNYQILRLTRPARYKPRPLEQLVLETGYSQEEVKQLYRAFKQECPEGRADEETFKEIYRKIFPLGESGKYAHLVFNCITKTGPTKITFDDFMSFLSTIRQSSQEEKIGFSFNFLDIDKNGVITQEELAKVSIDLR